MARCSMPLRACGPPSGLGNNQLTSGEVKLSFDKVQRLLHWTYEQDPCAVQWARRLETLPSAARPALGYRIFGQDDGSFLGSSHAHPPGSRGHNDTCIRFRRTAVRSA